MGQFALGFAGLTVPADIDGPPDLLHVLARFGVEVATGDAARNASLVVSRAGDRFRLSGPAYRNPFSVDGLDAVAGSIMAGLAACKALSLAPHMLCIHAAAACVGDRTMLFIAPFGTGKSSLMAELARRGADILSDDVVLLDLTELSATGVPMPMRLREAFLRRASPDLARWVVDRHILSGSRYTFLPVPSQALWPRRLTDIVLLNRSPSDAAQAVLEAASPGQIIPRILWHNMSRHQAPSALSDMASALASSVRGAILHFSDSAAAAEHLLAGGVAGAADAPPLASRRHEDLHITRTDRGAIVSDDETGCIFEINESAFIILTLLQEFADDDAVWQMLCTLYPEVPQAQLGMELKGCLHRLFDCGLVDFERAHGFTAGLQP